jgi:hypothetical protein
MKSLSLAAFQPHSGVVDMKTANVSAPDPMTIEVGETEYVQAPSMFVVKPEKLLLAPSAPAWVTFTV